MPLCGATVCGCAVTSVPATVGELDGFLPTIDVAGNGTTISPWNFTLNDDWILAFLARVLPEIVETAATTGTIDGEVPTIEVTGTGIVGDPWELIINPLWIDALLDAIADAEQSLTELAAASGAIGGDLPTIVVAGAGTVADPWELTINSAWVEAVAASLTTVTTFVPTLTQSATPTKTVTRASYWSDGPGITGDARLAVTSSGTGSNAVVVGLPVATHASYSTNDVIGSGWIFDASAGFFYYGDLTWASSTTARFQIRTNGAAATYLGSTTFTAALATSDIVQYQFSYEPA